MKSNSYAVIYLILLLNNIEIEILKYLLKSTLNLSNAGGLRSTFFLIYFYIFYWTIFKGCY